MKRLRFALLIALLTCAWFAAPAHAQAQPAFAAFIEGLWPEAKAMGVSRATFDAAFKGVTPDLGLPDLVLPGRTESIGARDRPSSPARRRTISTRSCWAILPPRRAASPRRTRRPSMPSRRSSASTAASCWRSGAARRRSARTSCRTTPSGCWRRRPTPAAARRCSAPSCCSRLKMLEDSIVTIAEHARVVGRRDGPDAVHADRILPVGLRPR